MVPVPQATNLLHKLEENTAEATYLWDSTPFGQARDQGKLSRESYIIWLRTYLSFFPMLEQAFPRNPHTSTLWTPDMRRGQLLVSDLQAMEASTEPIMCLPIRHLIRLFRKSACLVGTLYVFEASTSQVEGLQVALQEGPGATSQMTRFVFPYGPNPEPNYGRFRQRLLTVEPGLHEQVIEGALRTLDALRGLFEGLPTLDRSAP